VFERIHQFGAALDPLAQHPMLGAQMRIGVGRRIGQHPGDLVQAEVEFAVAEDLAQPAQVVRVVPAVTGACAAARTQQRDVVVVMQRAHRDVRELGHLSY
jgi:hypothetical protein